MDNNQWGNNNWGGQDNSYQQSAAPVQPVSRSSSLMRTAPNWISLGIALAFILCFLFLPFVKVLGLLPFSGMTLMVDVNAIMCLPLVVGVLMMLSAMFFDAKISACIGGFSAVLVLVLLLCSNDIMVGADINRMLGDMAKQYIGYNISGLLTPRAGLGCIFCIALAVIFVIVELLMANGIRRSSSPLNQNPWTDL